MSFDLDARRQAILAAWRDSPTRFREDANAEEDLVLGAYADRLLVELLQNAADAAARAGVPGRVRVAVADGVLSVANTGAPLDPAGVDGLTSLRASAKRPGGRTGERAADGPGRRAGEGTEERAGESAGDGLGVPAGDGAGEGGGGEGGTDGGGGEAVGRLGVGFAAALAVSDEPAIRSRHGGVRFSAAQTRAAVAGIPHLAEEAARRDGRVPVLRLPWPDDEPPPPGYDTEVRLPLRAPGPDDTEPRAPVPELGFDEALLLTFPALGSVEIGGRVVERAEVEARWRVARRSGTIPAELLADRPVEERSRDGWSFLAAVPLAGRLATPQVVHAPTPSDEPLTMPVRLIGPFPLDVGRRRVPSGPLTDWLAARAGATVADLIAAGESVDLVPEPGFGAAPLDAAIRTAVRTELGERDWLSTVDGGKVRPGRAVAVDHYLVPALTGVIDGLLPAGRFERVLATLGTRVIGAPEIVAAVTGRPAEPRWWHDLYAGLDAAFVAPADREALAALPVPLHDGRLVTGPRGVLLPGGELPADAVAGLGLRVAHPDAVHPLLEALGAVPATPTTVLDDPRVRAQVAASYDEEDPAPIADAVLALLAAGATGGLWLAELALPGDDGEWYPAGELLLPGGRLAAAVSPSAPFGVLDPALVTEYGRDAVLATGVLDTFAVVDEPDVDDFEDLALDDVEEWAESVGDFVRVERLRAVRDLEYVHNWPAALALLAEPGPVRDALAAPCHVITDDGRRVPVVPYTRWWLARRPVLGGYAPIEVRLPAATDLAGLYDEAPGDPALAALLGAWPSVDAVLADPGAAVDLLARLADETRTADPALLASVYPRLAEALGGLRVAPPRAIRVAPDLAVPASQAVVIDRPWLLDRRGDRYPLAGGADPAAVAALLGVPLLSDL